jgi:uncharacterized protein (DUF427 family)
MSVRVRDLLMDELDSLRFEPTDERIRGLLGERTVIDSTSAMLVWEPKRIVPAYAVPVEDIDGQLSGEPAASASESPDAAAIEGSQFAGRRVLDPSVPFSVHTSEGERLRIHSPGADREAAAFRPFDADLAGYILLDFDAFDAWYREDERNVGHPRDPFHRIDIVHSSRQVRVETDGELLAESSNACFLFEPPLPVRYYLPPEDVRRELLRPSDTKTFCAYKGQATYWSLEGQDDLVWSYPEPLRDAAEVTGRLAFFNERVDTMVDGVRLERPVTPWSPR